MGREVFINIYILFTSVNEHFSKDAGNYIVQKKYHVNARILFTNDLENEMNQHLIRILF